MALLLTTSGSTGSPKLVRLSHTNLEANAASIARYLRLGPDDRSITSLPLHYCYGLSVLHSHLLVGGAVALTDLSVTDPCFWAQAREARVTGLAGVPYTFDMLDRVGFADMDLGHLRYLTQAGGRMSPEKVRAYAELGRRRGFELFVMYGQTEATARMAYLPPELATTAPDAIGIAVPGGSFHLEPGAEDPAGPNETSGPDEASPSGELVYRGPNVMMGYAETPADLARGPELDELRTGDLARLGDDGLYRITGRASRFLKLFGLRVDLDRVERLLADAGLSAVCTGDDDGLVIALEGGCEAQARAAVATVVTEVGLPRSAVTAWVVDELPRLANGKPDHVGIRARAAARPAVEPEQSAAGTGATSPSAATAVRAVLAEALDLRPDDIGPDDTFVALGGDSLSYVEVSVALEGALGRLPEAWHLLPVAELEAIGAGAEPATGPRWFHAMETNVVLRALSIALVVGSHAGSYLVLGGAHVLLVIAGFNFARFRLPAVEVTHPTRKALASIARIAVPVGLWAAFQVTYAEAFRPSRLFFANNYLGSGFWVYWYVEVLLQLLVVLTLVFAFARVRALERRHPEAFAFGVLAAGLALRFAVEATFDRHVEAMHMTDTLVWCFALGWAAQRTSRLWSRLALSAIAWWSISGFFYGVEHDAVVLVGVLALIWVPHLPVLRGLDRLVAAVAAASLYIYLVHFAVLRELRGDVGPWVLTGLGLAAGWAAFVGAGRVEGALVAAWRRRPRRRDGQSASTSVTAAAN
nr:AMP-binding protein [Rhabdothermincola salaria]